MDVQTARAGIEKCLFVSRGPEHYPEGRKPGQVSVLHQEAVDEVLVETGTTVDVTWPVESKEILVLVTVKDKGSIVWADVQKAFKRAGVNAKVRR